MNYKTHQVAGMLAAETTLLYFQQHHMAVPLWTHPIAILVGQWLGTIADIDKEESHIGEQLFPLSKALRLIGVRHRTVTHSLLLLLVLWWFCVHTLKSGTVFSVFAWSQLIAYASHPFIDLFNPQGVELFWPIPIRIRLLPKFLSITVRTPDESIGETFFRTVLLIAAAICILVTAMPALAQIPGIGPVIEQGFTTTKHFL